MLALYIILGIILLVIILLHFSVVASIDFKDENADIKVKYLFFTLYPLKEKKPKKISKRKRKKLEKELQKEKQEYKDTLEKIKTQQNDFPKKQDGKNQKENKTTKKEPSKKDKGKLKHKINKYKKKWEKIKPYIPLGKKVVKKLLKAIKIRQLEVYITVADEDAYECAMKYGKINAAVYNVLALIKNYLTVSIKHIEVNSKFNSNESEYRFAGKIKVRPSTVIAIAFFILINYIHTNVKLRHNKN